MTTLFFSLLIPAFVGSASALSAPELAVSSQPAATQSVPRGAQRIPMLTLTLEASCYTPEATVSAITLTHEGLGKATDVSAVYAYIDGKRVTRSAVPSDRTGLATLRFRGLKIPACKTVTLQILADLSADGAPSGQHGFSLRKGSDIAAGGVPVRLLPAKTAPRVSAAPLSQGTITVSYLDLPRRLEYGSDRIVLRFRLSADSEANHLIDAITFTNDGKARDSDLQNLWIGNTRGEAVSDTLASMDGEKVRIVFGEPLLLEKNEDLTLLLHADIRASRRQTVGLHIEEPSDIEARSVKGRISR